MSKKKLEELSGFLLLTNMLVPGCLAVYWFGVFVQEAFGPGIGTPWKIDLPGLLVLIPGLILSLLIGIVAGTPIGVLLATATTLPSIVKKQLIYPGVPFFSWYAEKLADAFCSGSDPSRSRSESRLRYAAGVVSAFAVMITFIGGTIFVTKTYF